MNKILDVLGNIVAIAFIVICLLFNWFACVVNSRSGEGEKLDREDTESNK